MWGRNPRAVKLKLTIIVIDMIIRISRCSGISACCQNVEIDFTVINRCFAAKNVWVSDSGGGGVVSQSLVSTPGPRFIKLKRYEILLILVTFACRLRDYKKLFDFPRMSPSLTCIGRIRAL